MKKTIIALVVAFTAFSSVSAAYECGSCSTCTHKSCMSDTHKNSNSDKNNTSEGSVQNSREFANPTMTALKDELKSLVKGSGLGENQEFIGMERAHAVNNDYSTSLNQIMISLYMDDITASPAGWNSEEISTTAELLNYRKKNDEETNNTLKNVEMSLRAAYQNSLNDLKLYSLISNGYGSFGEGNGFAVIDTTNGETLIVITGYAE